MKEHKFELAHEKWPKTAITRDGGIQITGRYTSPGQHKAIASIFLLVGFMSALVGELRFAVLVALSWPFLHLALWSITRGKFDVIVYPDRIALPGRFGAKKYSRQMPIEFRVAQHSSAVRNPQAYGSAIEVVMQYGEKRIRIAEMPGEDIEKAQTLVIRLQNVCMAADEMGKMATKAGIKPSAEHGAFGTAPDIG